MLSIQTKLFFNDEAWFNKPPLWLIMVWSKLSSTGTFAHLQDSKQPVFHGSFTHQTTPEQWHLLQWLVPNWPRDHHRWWAEFVHQLLCNKISKEIVSFVSFISSSYQRFQEIWQWTDSVTRVIRLRDHGGVNLRMKIKQSPIPRPSVVAVGTVGV